MDTVHDNHDTNYQPESKMSDREQRRAAKKKRRKDKRARRGHGSGSNSRSKSYSDSNSGGGHKYFMENLSYKEGKGRRGKGS